MAEIAKIVTIKDGGTTYRIELAQIEGQASHVFVSHPGSRSGESKHIAVPLEIALAKALFEAQEKLNQHIA